jgi:hypothetical protein
MPIQTTLTVTTAELRPGDHIANGPTKSFKNQDVDSVSLRAKRATVTFESDLPGKADCDRNATFLVMREVATEAEQAAQRDELIDRRLRNRRVQSAEAFRAIRVKIASQVTTEHGTVSHWDFSALVETQATEELWARVEILEQRQAERFAEMGEEAVETQKTFAEIVELVRERCREDLLSFRASSRSTSTMSNAVEDAQLEAKREFVSRWI